MVGIADMRNHCPAHVLGQQQHAAIFRALAIHPWVLLFANPPSKRFRALVTRLRAKEWLRGIV